MHKLYKENVPRPMLSFVPKDLEVHDCQTRQRKDFNQKLYRNSIAHRSFLQLGPSLWNSLSKDLKN